MAELILERSERLSLRSQAHHLNAGVLIGEKGLTDSVMREIDRVLNDHGLVKVHVSGDDREERDEIYHTIADTLGAARIQSIGKMLVFYRPQPEEKAQKKAAQDERAAIPMGKADPGNRGQKKAVAAKTAKSKKAQPKRVIIARKKPTRTTKKKALS